MPCIISPLSPVDLPELSRFLTTGFGTLLDADFATPDVLYWKYLEPGVPDSGNEHHSSISTGSALPLPQSLLARDKDGQIIGHLGLCRTAFEGQALANYNGRLSTIHIIDWLGSPQHRSVGVSLLRKAHQETATQFGLGVSQSALVVGERAGYVLRSLVPVYTRVVRPGYWLRAGNPGRLRGWVKLVLKGARDCIHPMAPAPRVLTLKRVTSFGLEINPIVENAKFHAILTERGASRLNYMLRFPRQALTGWHIHDEARCLRGIALLNVIYNRGDPTKIGTIVDCLLENVDVPLWRAAFLALLHELANQGADVVQAYGSTPWANEALQQAGFQSRFSTKFHIRDRRGLIPRGVVFHLTPLEGDYAYT
jgi:hypothetical protein